MTTQRSSPTPAAAADAGSPGLRHAERALCIDVIVNAPSSTVWEAWSSAEGLETFFAQKAHVEGKIGGAYEIFFEPTDERFSTKGCTLLSYLPQEMISFEWTLPRDMFPQLASARTWLVVQLRPAGAGRTALRMTQLGWGTGEIWDRAYSHMQAGWQMVAKQLEQRFEHGPIDWVAQRQMWEERRQETRNS